MVLAVSALVAGLVLLTLGADRFVVAAARLSRLFGLSPVLIGALVVGLGTSAPELLVSALAAARGEVDLALGNVVGSNTANITLVLGSTALVAPIVSRLRIIRREGLAMFAGLVVLALLLWDLELGRWEGVALAAAMLAVVGLLVVWAKSDVTLLEPSLADGGWHGRPRREILVGIATLGVTLLGADLLVRGAAGLADEVGVSSAFVGLVIVSVGTSLPELATGVAAARRGETDLVLGNVLGSNLFNSLAVAGVAALIGPGTVDVEFRDAMGFMLVAGILAGMLVTTGRRLERWEGAVLLASFVGFVAIAA